MKKIISIILLSFILIGSSSCLKRDDLEDITIYTTIYPIEFLTDTLYGYNSEVLSIYPDGINPNDYVLTEKQITDYSKASIFIYNGLSEEKQIAKNFINRNKDLRIIDVSYGLKYTYGVEELWLSPNNYLMLATTIKNNLQDFITNKYIKEEIENNYIEELEDALSLMDAELRSIGSSAKDDKKHTIVASSKVFKFLQNYGFEVICLDEEENLTTNNLNNLKNKYKDGTFKYIFIRSDETESTLIKELKTSYKAEVISYKMLINLSDAERKANENYFTLMKENIEYIKDATIGK